MRQGTRTRHQDKEIMKSFVLYSMQYKTNHFCSTASFTEMEGRDTFPIIL